MQKNHKNQFSSDLVRAIIKETIESPLISLCSKAKVASFPIRFLLAQFDLILVKEHG